MGLDVWHGLQNAFDVNIRGFGQGGVPRVLVMLNGRQVYQDMNGTQGWSTLPVRLEEIRQIEVVKGPFTAPFGLNAASGVINIVTFNPLYDKVNAATVRAGTQDYREISAVTTVRLADKAGLRLSAGAAEMDRFDSPLTSDTPGVQVDPFQYTFLAEAVAEVSPVTHVTLEASNSFSEVRALTARSDEQTSPSRTSSLRGHVSWESPVGVVEALLYRNSIWTDTGSPLTGPVIQDLDLIVGNLQLTSSLSASHILRTALEYRDSVVTVPGRRGEVKVDIASANATWNWTISRSLSFTSAARVDLIERERTGRETPPGFAFVRNDWNTDDTVASFNAGIVYRLEDGAILRLAGARGAQLPSAQAQTQELSFPLPTPFPAFLVGISNPTMTPAYVTSVELGYERAVEATGGRFAATIFSQWAQDVHGLLGQFIPSPRQVPGGPFYLTAYFDNVGDASNAGLELSLTGRVGNAWRWSANYTFVSSEDDLLPAPGGGDRALAWGIDFESSTPEHLANATVGYAAGPWEVDVHAQYRSATDPLIVRALGVQRTPLDALFLVNARVGYNLTDNFTVALTGKGLNHDSYRATVAPEIERRVFLSLTGKF